MRPAPSSEIFFRCTACRRRLAIQSAGAGHLVDCPNCGASLQVPQQSTIIPPARVRLAWSVAICGAALAGLVFAGLHIWEGGAHDVAPAAIQASAGAAPALAAPAAAGAPATRAAAADGDLAARLALEQQHRELVASHRAVSKQYEELANWVLTNMRGRFPLKERFVSRLRFSPVTEDFAVHPDLAEFLGVNEQEQGLLNDALAYGRDSMGALETTYLSVTQVAPDSVTLYIPPYEQEGAAVRDDLYRALETVLGRPRFDRLLEISEEELVRSYHYFGTAARTMMFQLTPSGQDDEPPYLTIHDGWVVPTGPGTRESKATESAVRELPKAYDAYLAWLPDFVQAYTRR